MVYFSDFLLPFGMKYVSGLKVLVHHPILDEPGTKELRMVPYRRLSLMKREELSGMLAAGYSLRATAQALSRAPSTRPRELPRHGTSPVTYRTVAAHQRAQRSAHQPRKPRELVRQLACALQSSRCSRSAGLPGSLAFRSFFPGRPVCRGLSGEDVRVCTREQRSCDQFTATRVGNYNAAL